MTLEILKGFGLLICCLRFWEQEDKPNSVIIFFWLLIYFMSFRIVLGFDLLIYIDRIFSR